MTVLLITAFLRIAVGAAFVITILEAYTQHRIGKRITVDFVFSTLVKSLVKTHTLMISMFILL